MKVQRRHLLPVALVSCLVLAVVALLTAHQTRAQQNPTTPAPSTTPAPKRPTAGNDEQIVINTDLITLTVTVTDAYGRYVSGLEKKHFTVFDDKVEQEIAFFSDDDAPVSVGVIFDVSGSMRGDKIRKAREALDALSRRAITRTSIS